MQRTITLMAALTAWRPFFSPHDEGAGGGNGSSDQSGTGDGDGAADAGGAGDAGGQGDDGGGDGSGAIPSFLEGVEGLTDEHKAYVGERSLIDVLNLGVTNRSKLSQKAEQYAKDEGFAKVPKKDASAEEFSEHFKQFVPDDPQEYLTARGIEPEKATAKDTLSASAAHKAGIPVSVLKEYGQLMREGEEEANKDGGIAAGKAINDIWGADGPANLQKIERAVAQLQLQPFMDAFPKPTDGVGTEQYVTLMQGILTLSERLIEGGGIDNDEGGGHGKTTLEQLTDVETEIGNLKHEGKPIPESLEERRKALVAKKAKEAEQ